MGLRLSYDYRIRRRPAGPKPEYPPMNAENDMLISISPNYRPTGYDMCEIRESNPMVPCSCLSSASFLFAAGPGFFLFF